MKDFRISVLAVLFVAPMALAGQSPDFGARLAEFTGGSTNNAVAPSVYVPQESSAPFSRMAIGGAVSPLGVGVQVTTLINPHINVRASSNMFNYATNFTTNGFTANAKLNFASAGMALDIYPTRFGFRISPGILAYNQNRLTASNTVAGGTSFTLNGDTFYSAIANAATGAMPVTGTAVLGMHSTRPAFTITSGWGNTIPRKGGHWSFPFEIGAAFVGAPKLNVNLGGWACYDQAETLCTDISSPTDPIAIQIQNDLHSQVSKWTNDLDPLKTYPIISGGLAYSFRTRR